MNEVVAQTLLEEMNQLYHVIAKMNVHARALDACRQVHMLKEPIAREIHKNYADALLELSVICHTLSVTAEDAHRLTIEAHEKVFGNETR